MKKFSLLALITLFTAVTILPSCNKDDNDEVKLTAIDSIKVKQILGRDAYAVHGSCTPYHTQKDVTVGTIIKTTPLVHLEESFDVPIVDTFYTYRYDVTACTLTNPSGAEFVTDFKYNKQDSSINIGHKILDVNTKYTLASTIALKQLVNGQWQLVVYNGKTMEYIQSVTFTTGTAAETINPTDILFSYPIDRQYNYMPDEYKEGYIMLSYNYRELFENTPASDYKIVIKNITDDMFSDKTIPYTVKESNEVEGEVIGIDYSLKDILFDPCQIYHLSFYCGDKNIYNIHFRTSQYRNLKSKMADCDWYNGSVVVSSSDALRKDMTQNVFMDEGFDILEYPVLNGIDNNGYVGEGNIQKCLIYITADLDNCEWYQNSIFKSLYTEYPLDYEDQGRIVQYPPADAFLMFNYKTNMYLTDEDIENKYTQPKSHEGIIKSSLVWFMDHDVRVRQKLNEQKNKSDFTILDDEIKDYYEPPNYANGDYPYFISFRLPGKNIITYSEKHVMTVKY